ITLLNANPKFRRCGPHRRRDKPPELGGTSGVDESHPDITTPGRWRSPGENCGNEKTAQIIKGHLEVSEPSHSWPPGVSGVCRSMPDLYRPYRRRRKRTCPRVPSGPPAQTTPMHRHFLLIRWYDTLPINWSCQAWPPGGTIPRLPGVGGCCRTSCPIQAGIVALTCWTGRVNDSPIAFRALNNRIFGCFGRHTNKAQTGMDQRHYV